MKAYFTLDKDVIEFSPMLLNGKTVSIESKGKYDLSSNKIQISGKVNPVGSFSIPGIKELTKPISEILQLMLREHGKIQNLNGCLQSLQLITNFYPLLT